MAVPLSLGSQISDIVPAPTETAAEAAPPVKKRMTKNTGIDGEIADRAPKSARPVLERIYTRRRPNISDAEDQKRGQMAMASM